MSKSKKKETLTREDVIKNLSDSYAEGLWDMPMKDFRELSVEQLGGSGYAPEEAIDVLRQKNEDGLNGKTDEELADEYGTTFLVAVEIVEG